jgi:hypothetical protein
MKSDCTATGLDFTAIYLALFKIIFLKRLPQTWDKSSRLYYQMAGIAITSECKMTYNWPTTEKAAIASDLLHFLQYI